MLQHHKSTTGTWIDWGAAEVWTLLSQVSAEKDKSLVWTQMGCKMDQHETRDLPSGGDGPDGPQDSGGTGHHSTGGFSLPTPQSLHKGFAVLLTTSSPFDCWVHEDKPPPTCWLMLTSGSGAGEIKGSSLWTRAAARSRWRFHFTPR